MKQPVLILTTMLLTIAAAIAPRVCAADKNSPSARPTASRIFTSAPTAALPMIDSLTRLDMIDYFNSGSPKASKNLFGGECRITAMDSTMVSFESSDIARHTIVLLPSGKETIVMLISTLDTPYPDSTIKFFDTEWKELRGKRLLEMPSLSDWTLPEARQRRDDIENAVPFILAEATFDPASMQLTLTNTLEDYFPEEVRELGVSSLRRSISFRWNGNKMTRIKP